MKVVANSSVLIALSRISKLGLLPVRFPEGILIPTAVWNEVVETGKGQPGAEEVASAPWIKVSPVRQQSLISVLGADLDSGEAAAIALACEIKADLVLLDEKDARRVARRVGIPLLGTIGVLIWARRQGLIPTLKDELVVLKEEGKFRVSDSVIKRAIIAVGESEG